MNGVDKKSLVVSSVSNGSLANNSSANLPTSASNGAITRSSRTNSLSSNCSHALKCQNGDVRSKAVALPSSTAVARPCIKHRSKSLSQSCDDLLSVTSSNSTYGFGSLRKPPASALKRTSTICGGRLVGDQQQRQHRFSGSSNTLCSNKSVKFKLPDEASALVAPDGHVKHQQPLQAFQPLVGTLRPPFPHPPPNTTRFSYYGYQYHASAGSAAAAGVPPQGPGFPQYFYPPNPTTSGFCCYNCGVCPPAQPPYPPPTANIQYALLTATAEQSLVKYNPTSSDNSNCVRALENEGHSQDGNDQNEGVEDDEEEEEEGDYAPPA